MSRVYGGWEEDDLLLAETVLRYVRNGDTVNDACKEVERILDGKRKFSTLKYRWFIVLKPNYLEAYEMAKSQAQINNFKIDSKIKNNHFDNEDVDIEDLYKMIKTIRRKERNNKLSQEELFRLDKENMDLKDRLAKLEEDNKIISDLLDQTKEKNNDLIRTIKTLRSVGFDIEEEKKTYKVDRDGLVAAR